MKVQRDWKIDSFFFSFLSKRLRYYPIIVVIVIVIVIICTDISIRSTLLSIIVHRNEARGTMINCISLDFGRIYCLFREIRQACSSSVAIFVGFRSRVQNTLNCVYPINFVSLVRPIVLLLWTVSIALSSQNNQIM